MLPALRNASPDDRPAGIAWGRSVKVNADAKTRSVNLKYAARHIK